MVEVAVVSRSKHMGIQNLHENENNTKLNDDLVLKKIFEGKEKKVSLATDVFSVFPEKVLLLMLMLIMMMIIIIMIMLILLI